MPQLNLELPDTTYNWLSSQAKIEQFSNINAYLQNLINKEQQQQTLQQEITKGIKSGISQHSFSEIIEQTKSEIKTN